MPADRYQITLPDGAPLPLRPSEAPPLTESDKIHILWGDARGGGHSWQRRAVGKREFPERWDEDRIVAEVAATIAGPQFARWDELRQRLSLYRVSDDVMVYAALHRVDGRWYVATSFPINGDGVVLNHPARGRVALPLVTTAWLTYP